jgi:hypothetical protein
MRSRNSKQLAKSPVHTKLWRFLEAIIDVAPETSGVYALWKNAQLIYYGRAEGDAASIRACLFEHLRGQRSKCTAEATHYSWELAMHPAGREGELLSDYWSAYSRFPSCNEAETIERVVKKIPA